MEQPSPEDREDRAAELLGQIRDSLSEFVRALNEEAARARRIADEVQHKHDIALQELQKLGRETHTTNLEHGKLLSDIRQRWPKYIKVEAEEVAVAQARACSEATVDVVEGRLHNLTGGLSQLTERLQSAAGRVENVSTSLRWKTLGHAGLIAMGAISLLFPASVWWGGRSLEKAAEAIAYTRTVGYERLKQISRAELESCNVNGARRLCVRIEPGLQVSRGTSGATFAVIHGY